MENYPEIVAFTPSYVEHCHKVNKYSFRGKSSAIFSFTSLFRGWGGCGGVGELGVNS